MLDALLKNNRNKIMGATEDHDELIRQGVVQKNLKEDIDELKRDKKAGIVAILMLVLKSFFDHFAKGN